MDQRFLVYFFNILISFSVQNFQFCVQLIFFPFHVHFFGSRVYIFICPMSPYKQFSFQFLFFSNSSVIARSNDIKFRFMFSFVCIFLFLSFCPVFEWLTVCIKLANNYYRLIDWHIIQILSLDTKITESTNQSIRSINHLSSSVLIYNYINMILFVPPPHQISNIDSSIKCHPTSGLRYSNPMKSTNLSHLPYLTFCLLIIFKYLCVLQ